MDGAPRVRIGSPDARQHEPASLPRSRSLRARAIHARREEHATYSYGGMALMGVHANIGQPRSMWVQTPSGLSGAEADFAESARGARRRALILPREHGAWGLRTGSDGHRRGRCLPRKRTRHPFSHAAHGCPGALLAENSSGESTWYISDARSNQRGAARGRNRKFRNISQDCDCGARRPAGQAAIPAYGSSES